jgi:hypothetical protein
MPLKIVKMTWYDCDPLLRFLFPNLVSAQPDTWILIGDA